MQRLINWMLPLVYLTGLALIALANPDPLAREALCIHLSACFSSPNAVFWNLITGYEKEDQIERIICRT
ncbi:hypothetical protein [Sinorhizobium fredii]|uniref:hypothetical protein n=1 Tax=Rhizobium fredii TaxID=380 RepID=UPI0004B4CBE2|nr:hypothetical protein [Sinorhizobium fredii]ASY68797.1 hypothetical protein SF83666_c13740 [Sinorhizobium fredii CCBAU 83666]